MLLSNSDFKQLELHSDEYFMRQALREAFKARDTGEVPVGAVIVSQNQIIARAYNQVERLQDATAHAEMIAVTSAMSYLGTKYLRGCTLYVTLEPCLMCAGALSWSQLDRIVYGTEDPKKGFMRYGKETLHPKTKLEFGILANDCAKVLLDFFKSKRGVKQF